MTPIVLLAILASQTVGGLASILTKLALQGLAPWTMVFLRQALGVVILFAFSRLRPIPGSRTPFTRRDVALLCTASWGGFALPQVLLAIGIERSTGSMGALLTPLEPIGIVIGGVLLLGDRLRGARLIAILLGSAGAITALSQGHMDARLGDPLGDVLIAFGHLSWAIYTLAAKPLLERHDPMRVAVAIVLLSLAPIGLFALSEPFDLERARIGILWVVLLAFTATAVGTWTWNYALRYVSAGTMASFVFLQPLVGLGAGALFLGESVGWLAIAGGAMIVGAVAIETKAATP